MESVHLETKACKLHKSTGEHGRKAGKHCLAMALRLLNHSVALASFGCRQLDPALGTTRGLVAVLVLCLAMNASTRAWAADSGNSPSVALPADSGDYTPCRNDLPGLQRGSIPVVCSESLMDPHEVSDILGKRISRTYLAVEVKVINPNSDFDYLLHDVRLGYDGMAVTSRDRTLLRGVAEKGQQLDPRNSFIRVMESLGTIGGGISTLGFASIGLKDAMNLFQGPLTSSIKSALPDFTVSQMQRLDDRAFTVQTLVVPKRSSVSMVVFLSRDVFLSADEQKALSVSWKGKHGKAEESSLLAIQRKLVVEVAGAHVSEVNTSQPVASKIEPKSAAATANNLALTLLGQNLDRATKVRIGEKSTDAPEGTLQLIDSDPTWAKVMISNLPKEAGSYRVYLETPTGHDVDTNQVFTVTE